MHDESTPDADFDRWRKLSGIVLAPAAFAFVYLTTGGHLSAQGQTLAAILSGVAVLWVTETLPLPVTAVVGPCLCVVMQVAPAKEVFAKFADETIFLFIGSFILARAMTLHRLDRRLALEFLTLPWVGGRPARVLAALGAVTVLISMWVSNTATAAMMTPIALGILNAMSGRDAGDSSRGFTAELRPFATAMLLMIAYGAAIGGIGTPVGSPPNLITLSYLRDRKLEISFFRWMAVCVPLLAVMTSVLYVLLRWLHPSPMLKSGRNEGLDQFLKEQRAGLGGWTAGQFNTLAAFGFAIGLWMLPGFLHLLSTDLAKAYKDRCPESVAAIGAAFLLFVLPTDARRGKFTITWDEAAKIDWGTILLFGGGLTLGSLMDSTGVARAVGESLTSLTGVTSLWGLTAMSVVIGLVLSETSSNTAAAQMVIPVVYALAVKSQVNPIPPALGACLGASYGFMFPVSTPPNAIVYGTGLVPITKMVRAGILFDLLGAAIIIIGLRLLCPWLGLS